MSQADHPSTPDISNTGTTDHNCVTSAHETLPWGSHYRNLVTAPGHAWVAFALEHDPPGTGGRDSCSGGGGRSRS